MPVWEHHLSPAVHRHQARSRRRKCGRAVTLERPRPSPLGLGGLPPEPPLPCAPQATPTPGSPAPRRRPGGFVSAPYIAADSCHLLCLVTPPRAPSSVNKPASVIPPGRQFLKDPQLQAGFPQRPFSLGLLGAPGTGLHPGLRAGADRNRHKAPPFPPWAHWREKSVMCAPF